MTGQGYDLVSVDKRRDWIQERVGGRFHHIASFSTPTDEMRGNIENAIGVAQVPLGVAGPLLIHGKHASGTFYVPMATTEGALVRSYERGMVAITRAGGATTRTYADENRIAPVFLFDDVTEAHDFACSLPELFEEIRQEAESTTRYGKLVRIECHPIGREVIVTFSYRTGDAHGMNMIAKATQRACQTIISRSRAQRFYLFSGFSSEKRASGSILTGGKGKKTIAGARLGPSCMRTYLHTTPRQMVELWRHTMLGHLQASAIGYNGHLANGLTAIFLACGQDVANVVNSAVGITNFELTAEGDLYASVTLPSLTVATIGGGTALGTARECLQILGCEGEDKALKLAEIVAAALLAGELSMGAAIASGEFVEAHESYGRNRPRSNE
ncbi:MAG TPA: hydroxymethylglutaryl-CoA reductase [Blastocatellia bacterium]|nr:hydroxymethylglutaryl-CoA reductase [Blastocatellia bacterium]